MKLGIFGGSFNPVHVGHLRLAVEAFEALGLDRVDMVPAHVPPHKGQTGLLPFEFRLELLRLASEGSPWLQVNDLEGSRQGPSYTYDTLESYAREYPDAERFFLLGSTDLLTLPSWYRGAELPRLAGLAAMNRMDIGQDSMNEFICRFWPGAEPHREHIPDASVWGIPGGGKVYHLGMPRLDVSSSQVRRLWLQGREILGLAPDGVLAALRRQGKMVTEVWKG